ncbi:MAG: fatty acid desaturase [Planctomycetaceae bacterium]
MSEHAPPETPIPTRLNLAIVAAQLAAAFAVFCGTAVAGSWWELALLAAAFAVVGNSIYAVVHEAEHRLLHPSRKLNDVLGAGMALFFPAPFHLIRQGHIGHHQRNRSDDEAFDLFFDGESPLLRRLQLYGILTGMYWWVVVLSNFVVLVRPSLLTRRSFEFNRPSAALMESLNPNYWGLIRLEAFLAIALHAAIVWGIGIPLGNYVIVYFGFGFSWSAMQYVHHFGTERHVLRGARNLWLFAPIDWLWLHHNWHRTHHRHPAVPWIHLPRFGRAEDPEREFLVRHYFRMWRGPRHTDEHVENRYAGRIIR